MARSRGTGCRPSTGAGGQLSPRIKRRSLLQAAPLVSRYSPGSLAPAASDTASGNCVGGAVRALGRNGPVVGSEGGGSINLPSAAADKAHRDHGAVRVAEH